MPVLLGVVDPWNLVCRSILLCWCPGRCEPVDAGTLTQHCQRTMCRLCRQCQVAAQFPGSFAELDSQACQYFASRNHLKDCHHTVFRCAHPDLRDGFVFGCCSVHMLDLPTCVWLSAIGSLRRLSVSVRSMWVTLFLCSCVILMC